MPGRDAFLTEYLMEALRTEDVKVFPLAGDASNRRYYRVVHEHASMVLMRWEPFDPDNYPFLSVQKHFHDCGVRVPGVVHMNPSKGLVLLEDLGDFTLERRFWESQKQEDSVLYYQMALDQLLLIHEGASARKTDCTAFKIQFDTEKFLWEMNYGKDNLILGVLGYKASQETLDELQKVFLDICEKLHREPKKIAHRDYHSRNLMIKLDEICVIDFQDARLGPVQYDLVSLFKDSYVDLNEKSTQTLMDYYIDRSSLKKSGDFSRERFDRIYELQSLQRCFKACGSFASFYHQRQDRRYLKYLPATLKRVLKGLTAFPEYKVFADVLIDSGALDKKYESL